MKLLCNKHLGFVQMIKCVFYYKTNNNHFQSFVVILFFFIILLFYWNIDFVVGFNEQIIWLIWKVFLIIYIYFFALTKLCELYNCVQKVLSFYYVRGVWGEICVWVLLCHSTYVLFLRNFIFKLYLLWTTIDQFFISDNKYK